MNKRRKILLAAGAAGAAGFAGGLLWWNRLRQDEHAQHAELPAIRDPAFPNALRLPGSDGMFGVIDVYGQLAIVARPVRHALLPDKPASMLAYDVEQPGKTALNPVFRARTGTTFRAKFWNAIDESSIIHWHGFKVDSNNDGHPHYAVPGGATYDYQFTIANRAAMYWYHPHPHHLTGKQVYSGLAGLFIVEDDEELALQKALDLEFGRTDIPLVLQDRRFDDSGQPVFAPVPEEKFHGHFGDQVLVNLTPRPHFEAATRIYRFRILNGSNARVYRLAFSHGERQLDYHVIGTDGGLLDRPYTVREAFLAPAERVDVLLDLRKAAPGDVVTLASLSFDAMHNESGNAATAAHSGHSPHAGHGAPTAPEHRHGALPDGTRIDLLKINVRRKVTYDRALPAILSRLGPVPEASGEPRIITLDQSRMAWRINGRSYEMMATPIVVKRGVPEVWEVRNAAASMPHPMHIHGFQSRVISRAGSPEQQQRLAVAENGLAATDLGWKDTVLAWPGETVRIVTDFSHPFLGDQVYMIHCHNLEHEDGGMMLNFKVAG
jgi:blue copper oxidase